MGVNTMDAEYRRYWDDMGGKDHLLSLQAKCADVVKAISGYKVGDEIELASYIAELQVSLRLCEVGMRIESFVADYKNEARDIIRFRLKNNTIEHDRR